MSKTLPSVSPTASLSEDFSLSAWAAEIYQPSHRGLTNDSLLLRSSMDHSSRDRARRVTGSKARLCCTLTIPGGHETESEVGLCIDHSGGYRKQSWVVHWQFVRVTRSKERLGCALTIPAGHEITSEVWLCIDHPCGITRSKARLGCVLTIPVVSRDRKRG